MSRDLSSQSQSPPAVVLDPFLRLVANVIVFNHQLAEQLGMGVSDMQFLSHLQREGALSPGRLSTLTGLRSGTVSGVLERLEAGGWVRRDRDPDDRRKVLVHLDQERVQRDIAPLYAHQAAALAEVYATFDGDQQAVIARFLTALADKGDRPD